MVVPSDPSEDSLKDYCMKQKTTHRWIGYAITDWQSLL